MSGELVKKEDYQVLLSAESVAQTLKDNLGGKQISQFDLDRVKVPSQGSTFFTVPSIDGEESVKELKGIVLHWSEKRFFWHEKFGVSGGATPPDCASEDGTTGIGDPGGACSKCKYAQFGSAMKENGEFGKGQACKLMRYLLVVRKNDWIPFVLCVPPSSLGNLRKLFLRLSSKAMPFYKVEIAFTLEKATSADGIVYSVIVPKVTGQLDPESVKAIEKYREQVHGTFESVKAETEDYHNAVNQ